LAKILVYNKDKDLYLEIEGDPEFIVQYNDLVTHFVGGVKAAPAKKVRRVYGKSPIGKLLKEDVPFGEFTTDAKKKFLPKNILRIVAANLRIYMAKHDYDAGTLSNIVGYSTTTIYNILKAKGARVQTITTMMEKLGISNWTQLVQIGESAEAEA